MRIDPRFNPPELEQMTTAFVTFDPRARTVWHVHPFVAVGCNVMVPVEEISSRRYRVVCRS
ncbi:hypothetical protein GKA01_14470 [Gluconobacter kanchanaburiensis NBRC 103587]|uniref:Uncharacterized protein n=1 Tax=Gluconobacter kanchanaburiensis NBRC 103587 TaxID=1307948 RepID=A0A511B706_9PROT|nr:hypothetical protein GKA01_14470 [Gluconobacter kanchanaburiensis NBRC 103587]